MNDIAIFPNEVESLKAEGIEFHNNSFIEINIDGDSISALKDFEDGTVFWPELKKSSEKSGSYLIFTCICGIAEDAGWEEVQVTHSESAITWEMDRRSYVFDKSDYISQVYRCEKLLNISEFPLAVENAVFPS